MPLNTPKSPQIVKTSVQALYLDFKDFMIFVYSFYLILNRNSENSQKKSYFQKYCFNDWRNI